MGGIKDTSAILWQIDNFWKFCFRENTGKAIVPIFYYTFAFEYCFPTEYNPEMNQFELIWSKAEKNVNLSWIRVIYIINLWNT